MNSVAVDLKICILPMFYLGHTAKGFVAIEYNINLPRALHVYTFSLFAYFWSSCSEGFSVHRPYTSNVKNERVDGVDLGTNSDVLVSFPVRYRNVCGTFAPLLFWHYYGNILCCLPPPPPVHALCSYFSRIDYWMDRTKLAVYWITHFSSNTGSLWRDIH